MPRIEVIPSSLRDVGASAQRVGTDVTGLAAGTHGLVAGGDTAPSATAGALHGFASGMSSGLVRLGDSVNGLGLTTDLAAGLYETTDRDVMPER
jgi:hypothetical protein